MIDVVPAIIADDFNHLREQMALVKGLVPRVQIDILDGRFAQTTSWPYAGDSGEFTRIVAEDNGMPFWEELDFEVDMMIVNPEERVDDWIAAGASALIIHLESVTDTNGVPDTARLSHVLKNMRKSGAQAAVALKPSTPLEHLEPLIADVDFVQLMGNDHIGEHGVSLDERIYEHAKHLRAKHPDLTISVDIGVNNETAPKLVAAGVTKLVSGSAIFGTESPREAIEHFRNLG